MITVGEAVSRLKEIGLGDYKHLTAERLATLEAMVTGFLNGGLLMVRPSDQKEFALKVELRVDTGVLPTISFLYV